MTLSPDVAGKPDLDLEKLVQSWQLGVTMCLSFALSTKFERKSFETHRALVMKERSKLPSMHQPCDASAWMNESRRIGCPSEILSGCFSGLVDHYGEAEVETILNGVQRESIQIPGFGAQEPKDYTQEEVDDLLRKEDPQALDAVIRFIVKSFDGDDVKAAWEKATTKKEG